MLDWTQRANKNGLRVKGTRENRTKNGFQPELNASARPQLLYGSIR